MEFDWSVVVTAMPALLAGAKLTIIITVLGLAGGIVLGLAAGLMRAYGGPLANGASFAYIELIRGTPIVVRVVVIYLALPGLAGARVGPMSGPGGAIAVNSGAYLAEIVRGAFLSVHKGLYEAGLAIGLPTWKVLLHVIGPVAFRRLIPPLGNQVIVSLKDTSLFIVIGVGELTRQGQEVMAATFRAVEIWTAVAILYLVMTGALSHVLRATE